MIIFFRFVPKLTKKKVMTFKIKTKISALIIIVILFSNCGVLKKSEKGKSSIATLTEKPKPDWSFPFGGKIQPTINNGIVYIPGNKMVKAIDLNTHKELWKFKVDFKMSKKCSVFGENIILKGTQQFCVVNNKTGKLKWKMNQLSPYFKILFTEEIIVYRLTDKSGTTKRDFCVADINTGELKWKYSPYGNTYPEIKDSTIVIMNTHVQQVGQDEYSTTCNMTGYKLYTGEQLWNENLNEPNTEDPQERMIGISENKVITLKDTLKSNKMIAYNIISGKRLWGKECTEKTYAKISDNKIFLTNTENIYCYNNIGNEIWNYKFATSEKKSAVKVKLFKNEKLFVLKDKVTYVFTPDGKLLWKNDKINWNSSKRPYKSFNHTVSKNYFIIETDTEIAAYDLNDGTKKWVYKSYNKTKLNSDTYNETIYLSLPEQKVFLAFNNSDNAMHCTVMADSSELFSYKTGIFESLQIPANKGWTIKNQDATMPNDDLLLKEMKSNGWESKAVIRTIKSGNWKSNLEDTTAALKSIKGNEADFLLKYNERRFKKNKHDEPSVKLTTLKNGTKAILVECELKIEDEKNKYFGNSYYARNYYLLAKKNEEKAHYPVISSSVTLTKENYNTDKKNFQELIDHIANTAVLKSEYKVLK